MTNSEQLISYILTLTPEQVDVFIRQMPRLMALTNETPTQYIDYLKNTIADSVYATNDESLLTCIYSMLMSSVIPERQTAEF